MFLVSFLLASAVLKADFPPPSDRPECQSMVKTLKQISDLPENKLVSSDGDFKKSLDALTKEFQSNQCVKIILYKRKIRDLDKISKSIDEMIYVSKLITIGSSLSFTSIIASTLSATTAAGALAGGAAGTLVGGVVLLVDDAVGGPLRSGMQYVADKAWVEKVQGVKIPAPSKLEELDARNLALQTILEIKEGKSGARAKIESETDALRDSVNAIN